MLSLVRLRRVALVQALAVTLTIVLCVMAVLRYENGKQRLYEAKARIAISQTYAKSAAEADAVVAQARALATSRAIVAEAMRSANANRDVDSVARKTTLSSLGTSPIAQLTVRDRDPRVAARLANGIAGAVVSYLQDAARGQVPALVHQLNLQLQQLTSQYELLLTDSNAPVEQIAAVSSQMSNVQQQLLTLRANDAQQLQPSVID